MISKVGTLVKLGIADMKLAAAPDLLKTSGLGSCVGIVLFDALQSVAGMVHIMLPSSKSAKNQSDNLAKFADTGIEQVYKALIKEGAAPERIKAKIAGGAQMFQFSSTSELMRIGPRNIAAVRRKLNELNILIVAEDVGGKSGRTIEFDSSTCLLKIRTVHKGEKTI
ncbi:chemoreceptor glutamine deamidase CheD [Halobacillus andaensis]|uniref:Probable chemoreceptor glutamine deamidase CheD n=1 Tax=Halobacillus andaensis TaxID=1176239 RepID=A0A917AYK3_HALAA|nr:chemotaxis protein CheD [Halobacillus andaensis]MBP2003471.1 chemotaxis protein CheD [Halobacillus andaensis]GGF10865.1 chemoreceptor glutamine deamidase CheD [Halobacillus andaensis]